MKNTANVLGAKLISCLFISFLFIGSSANARYWNVHLGSYGLSGGPYTPGQTMGVSFSVCANRNASHNIPIDIYLSWDASGVKDTFLKSTTRYVQQPGSYCSVGSTTNFTLPNTPPVSPFFPCYPSGTFYILLKHNGVILKAIGFSAVGPSITSINASSAFVGAQITLKGTNLDHLLFVNFYETSSSRISATINSSSSSAVTFTVPAGAATGTIQLSGSCFFLYTGSVTILPSYLTSFSPKAGIVNAPFTLKGNGFLGATAVKFQGTSASFTIVDQFTITAYLPPGAPSTGTISVEAGNTVTSSETYTKTSCSPFANASFEEDLPTWAPYNADNGTTFESLGGLGGFGTSSRCIGIDNYGYNSPGTLDGIIAPDFCLSSVDALTLSFDVAYAYYSATVYETLYVFYALNGSGSYALLWSKSGANLATAGIQTSSFVPSSSQWRTETISLTSLIGSNTSIQILIVQANGYGNNLFLDNIRMGSSPIVWSSLDTDTWSSSGNWSSGSVPGSGDEVLITNQAVIPAISANVSISELHFEGDAELNIENFRTLSVSGIVDGSDATVTGGGKLSLNGSSSQTLSLSSISNLDIFNSTGADLGADLEVSDNLNFSSGNLAIGDHDLLIADAATISGYDENEYVLTDGTGNLKRNVSSSSVYFPIGTSSTYNPAELLNSGTADLFSVRVVEGALTSGTSGSPLTANAVNRTWFVEEATTGGSNVNLTLQWNASDELTGFDRTKSGVGHFSGSAWVKQAGASATSGSVSNSWKRTVTGLTSFSPFGIGDANSPLPVELMVFKGHRLNLDQVQLNWSTASELNNLGFEIERRLQYEGDFEIVGFVSGMGTTSSTHQYEFIDQNGFNELAYYRLKQVDYNGEFDYSRELVILPGTGESESDWFDLELNSNGIVIVTSFDQFLSHIAVFSASGQLMFERSGSSSITFSTAIWPRGVYLIKAYNYKGISVARKVFLN